MACFDPNSLTASGTGELSVHIKPASGLVSSSTGIGIDLNTVAPNNGLSFVGGKLTAAAPAQLDHYKAASSGSAGYIPLPIGVGGAVTVVGTSNIFFSNITSYQMLYMVSSTFVWDVDCLAGSEWRGDMNIYANGVLSTQTEFKFRNDVSASGLGGATGQLNTFVKLNIYNVAPGGSIYFSCTQSHYAHHGTVQLQRSSCFIEAFGLAMPVI